MTYPLDGIRVLDLSRVLSGPYAGRMLSDLGADVLKVEPPDGDVTRQIGKKVGDASGYYIQHNVGKRNVCIDLKKDGAAELIIALAQKADVVIENFRPGVMDRLGVGWDQLREANPKLIMLSISGYGQDGPERDRGAYAPLLHAETGLLARQSRVDGGTGTDICISLGDTLASLHGTIAVLAAINHVRNTGVGQHIDMAMLNALHATDDFANMILDDTWTEDQQLNRCRIWDAPGLTKIAIAGAFPVIWKALLRDEALVDPASEGQSKSEKTELRMEALQNYLLTFTDFDALTERLDGARVHWGRVRDHGIEAYSLPSVGPRGVHIEVDDGAGGLLLTMQSPYRFSNAESGVSQGAKTSSKGEDNFSALKDWLNWSDDQIRQSTEEISLESRSM